VNGYDGSADYSTTFMTYHPASDGCDTRGNSSSQWYHTDEWLDANGIQTFNNTNDVYNRISMDYSLTPPKPTILLEAEYESSDPVNTYCGRTVTTLDVRRQGYQAFLGGGMYTYGSVIDLANPSTLEHFDLPGALQNSYLIRFLTSLVPRGGGGWE